MAVFCKPHQEEVLLNALQIARAVNTLRLARKESTQAFTRASYSSEVQAVFDLVEKLDNEGALKP